MREELSSESERRALDAEIRRVLGADTPHAFNRTCPMCEQRREEAHVVCIATRKL